MTQFKQSLQMLFRMLLILMVPFGMYAQAPLKMNYQAVIRNATGEIMQDQLISMRISILIDSVDGTAAYMELHHKSTNSRGVLSLEIGGGEVESGSISLIDWSSGVYFLKTEVDPAGGTNFTISGVSQLLSVPYAFYASSVLLKKNNRQYTTYIKDDGSIVALPAIAVEKPYKDPLLVTDADGNEYGTVRIGTQVWLDRNLRTTRLSDGTVIPHVPDSAGWVNLTSPGYCSYLNTTDEDTIHTYGLLYNWHTVSTDQLCPTGFHVPSDSDWLALESYLGTYAGGRIKESGTTHWLAPNTDAIGDSRLDVLPAGARWTGLYFQMGSWSSLWTSDEKEDRGIVRGFYTSEAKLFIQTEYKTTALSVRCIKN